MPADSMRLVFQEIKPTKLNLNIKNHLKISSHNKWNNF